MYNVDGLFWMQITKEFNFFHTNTTLFMQPMVRDIIHTCKALYTQNSQTLGGDDGGVIVVTVVVIYFKTYFENTI